MFPKNYTQPGCFAYNYFPQLYLLTPPLILDGVIIDRVNSHCHFWLYVTLNIDWSLQVNQVT